MRVYGLKTILRIILMIAVLIKVFGVIMLYRKENKSSLGNYSKESQKTQIGLETKRRKLMKNVSENQLEIVTNQSELFLTKHHADDPSWIKYVSVFF